MMGGKMMQGKMLRPFGDDDSDSDDDDVVMNKSDSSSDDSSSDDDSDDEDKKPSANKEAAAKKDAQKKSANLSSSDDDSSSDDEDDKKPAAAKRSRDDSDDDDSSDDDSDDDEVEKTTKKAKKKRPKISFFDEEAEASDDDEDDEKLKNKDISKEYADEEAKALMAQQDRRRQQAGGWMDGLGTLTDDKEKDDSEVARIAKELEERHRMERRILPRAGEGIARSGGGDEELAEGFSHAAVAQQSLVPSVSDPNLWMFSCITGKENELVYQIMNKCVAFAKRGRPLGITSVVIAQTKGKIYVESYSEPAVMEAIQGVRGIMPSTMTKVPISDMTTVMSVVPKKIPGEF